MAAKAKVSIFKKSIALATLWIFLCSDVSFALRPLSVKDRLSPDEILAEEAQRLVKQVEPILRAREILIGLEILWHSGWESFPKDQRRRGYVPTVKTNYRKWFAQLEEAAGCLGDDAIIPALENMVRLDPRQNQYLNIVIDRPFLGDIDVEEIAEHYKSMVKVVGYMTWRATKIIFIAGQQVANLYNERDFKMGVNGELLAAIERCLPDPSLNKPRIKNILIGYSLSRLKIIPEETVTRKAALIAIAWHLIDLIPSIKEGRALREANDMLVRLETRMAEPPPLKDPQASASESPAQVLDGLIIKINRVHTQSYYPKTRVDDVRKGYNSWLGQLMGIVQHFNLTENPRISSLMTRYNICDIEGLYTLFIEYDYALNVFGEGDSVYWQIMDRVSGLKTICSVAKRLLEKMEVAVAPVRQIPSAQALAAPLGAI